MPVTVYHDPKGETEYVLLDGERRWRAAALINLPTIPAWVTEKPTGVENTLTMFHIHHLRDRWGDIATAWALESVIDDTGITDDEQLREMTGLGIDTIRNMRRVLEFPRSWQEKIHRGEIPFNLLVEMDKAVLARRRNADRWAKTGIEKSEKQLRDLFLRRYEEGNFADVVDLRKIAKLIDTATDEDDAGAPRAQEALANYMADPKVSIDEAYSKGAAASIEVPRLLRDLDDLPNRLRAVMNTSQEPVQRKQVIAAVKRLGRELTRFVRDEA